MADPELAAPRPATAAGAPGWRAELALRFARVQQRTTLVGRRHTGPLVVQRPFYPEGDQVPHIYVLHPPGGLVGGDRLRLEVVAEEGARALVTTPAATKVYRSAGPLAAQSFEFEVERGATLEWLPQETILHDAAHAALDTEVHLAAEASFVGLETLCFGLSARGETFARGRCRQRFEIWRQGHPIFVERGVFDAGDAVHAASWGLAGARINGLLVIAPGQKSEDGALLTSMRAVAHEVAQPARAGVTILRQGDGEVWVCRYLGHSAEEARNLFHRLWALARPALLGRAAVAPRVWAT